MNGKRPAVVVGLVSGLLLVTGYLAIRYTRSPAAFFSEITSRPCFRFKLPPWLTMARVVCCCQPNFFMISAKPAPPAPPASDARASPPPPNRIPPKTRPFPPPPFLPPRHQPTPAPFQNPQRNRHVRGTRRNVPSFPCRATGPTPAQAAPAGTTAGATVGPPGGVGRSLSLARGPRDLGGGFRELSRNRCLFEGRLFRSLPPKNQPLYPALGPDSRIVFAPWQVLHSVSQHSKNTNRAA